MMSKQKSWHLDPKEVGHTRSSGTINGRVGGRWSKQSSAMNTRSMELTLTHLPSNISVSSELKSGHYSNTQMTHAIEKEEEKLFIQLQNKVAATLRIPGHLPVIIDND